MHAAAALFGALTVLGILWEAFETVILPRRIHRKLRFTRYFYLSTWLPWRAFCRSIENPKRRESLLGFFGPLSLVLLFATWAFTLMIAFGFLQWGMGSHLKATDSSPVTLGTDLYLSGTTMFTLGLGDITPQSASARAVTVVEAAVGFGLIALAISYLPTLYQSFARREVNISLLDARAGSPPSASEFLQRYATHGDPKSASSYLADCERWASELLESHMSYPALCYFRSQHANQSWLSAVTTVLDICVLIEFTGDAAERWQASLTFAMARHAVVDLTNVFHQKPCRDAPDRLPPEDFRRLCRLLEANGIHFSSAEGVEARIRDLRDSYEPFVRALSGLLALEPSGWLPAAHAHDNWSSGMPLQ